MRRLALLISIVAWAAGCGDQPPPRAAGQRAPETGQMTCQAGWSWNKEPPRGDDDVTAGPITLINLGGYAASDFSRPRAIYTKVVLEPRATTTLAVAPEDRDRVRLASSPPNDPHAAAGGDPAIRFEGCAPRTDDSREGEELGTGYAIGVMVDSPGEATLEITPEGAATIRRRVSFGSG